MYYSHLILIPLDSPLLAEWLPQRRRVALTATWHGFLGLHLRAFELFENGRYGSEDENECAQYCLKVFCVLLESHLRRHFELKSPIWMSLLLKSIWRKYVGSDVLENRAQASQIASLNIPEETKMQKQIVFEQSWPDPLAVPAHYQVRHSTTVQEAQKQQLKQPQTAILFWPSNILAMAVKSSKGLSFEEQMTLCWPEFCWESYLKS